MGILQVLNNSQLNEQTQSPAPIDNETITSALEQHITVCWEKAYKAKAKVKDTLLSNLRAYNSEYSPTKLAEIRALGGSELFIPLTATKANAAIAWMEDIIIQPSINPWSIEPTPNPTLPDDVVAKTKESVYQEVVNSFMMLSEFVPMDEEGIARQVESVQSKIDELVNKELRRIAKESLNEISMEIEDQLIEGGWYKALVDCLFDLVVLKSAFLKGPIFKKEKYLQRVINPNTNLTEIKAVDKIIPYYIRRSPFNIYPAPASTGINDGYLIDLITVNLKDLDAMRGVEGFNEETIVKVINEFKNGSLKSWLRFEEFEYKVQESGNSLDSSSISDAETINAIEFHGSVQGSMLIEWGMDVSLIPDPARQYEICAWLIGKYIIKAMLNYNPLGEKPYSTAGYLELPGSFWHKGLPELISGLQQICNSVSRATANNSAIASGPMVEINKERFPFGYDYTIYPWKQFESSDAQMSGAPAVRFYQPQNVTDSLIKVFDYYSKLADQYSVPSFAHGDTSVGGAGNTASGLSMLMGSAHRVIKKAIKNVDKMISASIEKLYYYNLISNPKFSKMLCDCKIVAKGSSSMLQKEQQAVRRTEFLTATNNPADLQILGIEGRKALLTEVAKTLDMSSLDNILPEEDILSQLNKTIEQFRVQQKQDLMEEQQANTSSIGSVPPPKSQTLDKAGNKVSGQNSRLVSQKNAMQQKARKAKQPNPADKGAI